MPSRKKLIYSRQELLDIGKDWQARGGDSVKPSEATTGALRAEDIEKQLVAHSKAGSSSTGRFDRDQRGKDQRSTGNAAQDRDRWPRRNKDKETFEDGMSYEIEQAAKNRRELDDAIVEETIKVHSLREERRQKEMDKKRVEQEAQEARPPLNEIDAAFMDIAEEEEGDQPAVPRSRFFDNFSKTSQQQPEPQQPKPMPGAGAPDPLMQPAPSTIVRNMPPQGGIPQTQQQQQQQRAPPLFPSQMQQMAAQTQQPQTQQAQKAPTPFVDPAIISTSATPQVRVGVQQQQNVQDLFNKSGKGTAKVPRATAGSGLPANAMDAASFESQLIRQAQGGVQVMPQAMPGTPPTTPTATPQPGTPPQFPAHMQLPNGMRVMPQYFMMQPQMMQYPGMQGMPPPGMQYPPGMQMMMFPPSPQMYQQQVFMQAQQAQAQQQAQQAQQAQAGQQAQAPKTPPSSPAHQ